MAGWNYEGLNNLDDSLKATNVLSENYRKDIMAWALMAVSEAYRQGQQDERNRMKGREEDSTVVPPRDPNARETKAFF